MGFFTPYHTIVFDCDGVILDSNAAKTKAFYQTALAYGEEAAQAFVAYHTANGGISRYKKFERFLREMLPAGATGPNLQELLADYALRVREILFSCAIAPGLGPLREHTSHASWLVISGADEAELHEVFAARGLTAFFDGGIFGSPATKDEIFARELANGNIHTPAIYLGDSRYDHQAATRAGLSFTFVSGWTDYDEWPHYCAAEKLHHVVSLSELGAL